MLTIFAGFAEHLTMPDLISIRTDEDIAELAFYTGTIKYMVVVEPYHPNSFLRQLGHVQRIPLAPYNPTRAQRGKVVASYVVKYNFQDEI
ncbi:hypothetical protein Scep_013942 [Stephania cephalantha]|uniref:Uncharacterized protein n=1 Tax=Stephania cephalantha TaxID=152367 RepID=A0AAP0P2I3_9MAGN